MRPLLLTTTILLSAALWGARADAPTPTEIGELADLVEGHDEELRERATRRLVEIGSAAVPVLQKRLAGPGRVYHRYILDRIRERAELAQRERRQGAAQAATFGREQLMAEHWPHFVRRYIETKIERLRDLRQREKFEDAIALVDALLVVEPQMPEALRGRLRALKKTLRSERFAATAIRGEIEVDKTVFTFGEAIRVNFVVHNRSAQQFLIRGRLGPGDDPNRTEEAARNAVLRVRYRVDDHHIDGNVLGKQLDDDLPIARNISLGKDEKWRLPWTVPAVAWPGDPGFVYREIKVEAMAIPIRMGTVGTSHDQTTIRFPPQRYRIFPRGYQVIAAEPMKFLAAGVRLGNGRNTFVSGLLVSPHQQKEAIELLVGGLGRHNEAFDLTLVALLERMTGKRLGRNVESWRLWWKAHRERFQPRG